MTHFYNKIEKKTAYISNLSNPLNEIKKLTENSFKLRNIIKYYIQLIIFKNKKNLRII